MPENENITENKGSQNAAREGGQQNHSNRGGYGHHNGNRGNRNNHRQSGQNRRPIRAEDYSDEINEGIEAARNGAESASALPSDAARSSAHRNEQRFHNDKNGNQNRGQQNQNRPQQNRDGKPQDNRGGNQQNSQNRQHGDRRDDRNRNGNDRQNFRGNGHGRGRNGDNGGQNKAPYENGTPAEEKPVDTVIVPDSLSADSIFAPLKKEESFLGLSKEDEALIDAMPPDPTLDAVFSDPEPVPERTEGVEIVGIHFPQGGKVYYFDPAGFKFEEGGHAIVETARGQELGEVAIANRLVAEEDIIQPLKPVVRIADDMDLAHEEENAQRSAEALKICAKKVEDHKLDMKLTGAQYTFDNAKLIFYFTAAQRVDFRELVKDLAGTFRTRIELRQIGTRDEARMVGGLGACGRKLCCSAFLPNYAQTTMKMAKNQGLAMNASKLSGNCGRLMCCLKFEESTYERELALMPTVDSIVDTPEGRGKVTDVRPVGYMVKVKLDEKQDAAPKAFHLNDIKVLMRAEVKADEDNGNAEEEN